MSGLLILILLFIGVPLLWRWLKPYFFRWMQRRTLNYIFNSMGASPQGRGNSRSRQRQSYSSSAGHKAQGAYSSSDPYDARQRSRRHSSGPLIPKEYAVDVEYTEIHSYSSEQTIASDGQSVRYAVESQVSDAEIIEIRRDR